MPSLEGGFGVERNQSGLGVCAIPAWAEHCAMKLIYWSGKHISQRSRYQHFMCLHVKITSPDPLYLTGQAAPQQLQGGLKSSFLSESVTIINKMRVLTG